MSTIKTLSSFTYGHTVTKLNCNLDFDEGGAEIQGVLNVGSYSLAEYVVEFQRVLNTFGLLTYTVTVDRATGKLTVAATGTFTLLAGTGSRVGTGVWTMAGFNPTNLTGTSVSGQNRCGKIYRPQYILLDYSSPEHLQLKESASVNTSANGQVQVLTFGDGSRMKCNIIAITDKLGLKVDPWYENANGLSDALDFMNYLITKAKIEFMPDFDDQNTFHKLLLDSTKYDRQGIGFELENMKTPDVYQTGTLTFRKVITL